MWHVDWTLTDKYGSAFEPLGWFRTMPEALKRALDEARKPGQGFDTITVTDEHETVITCLDGSTITIWFQG